MLIDVPISGDRNVIKKEVEKILKYKDLTIEIKRMWKVKTRVIIGLSLFLTLRVHYEFGLNSGDRT